MFRIAAAAAACLLSSASAQIPAPLAGEVLPNVDIATILPALQQMNLTTERTTLGGGDVLVVRQGNINIIMRPRVCNPECAGLLMYAIFEGTAPSGVLNAYNESTPPTTAFTSGGNTILSRYLIADYGITAGSFLVNVGVFESTVRNFIGASEQAAAQSVSLGDQGQVQTDPANQAFLEEIASRREYFSSKGTHNTY
ncbi:MAG: hypothetical protein V2I43_05575 [Parvularcula sp.]|jgi:hypothetical protein|nr:hypothetical protein [Parvularcula sp.]